MSKSLFQIVSVPEVLRPQRFGEIVTAAMLASESFPANGLKPDHDLHELKTRPPSYRAPQAASRFELYLKLHFLLSHARSLLRARFPIASLFVKDIANLQFLFVVGKGGAGRTTVSASIALSAAREGKRVLVAMCNTKERLSHMLDVAPIGPEIQTILPNIDAVNMIPTVALREYGNLVLKVPALYRAIFENRWVGPFLQGVPGLEAWSMLGKAYYHATEYTSNQQKRYDLVVLDAPATGHGLEMLRVPRVIVDLDPPGLLGREASKAWSLFTDASRSGVLIVTLPEELPTTESIELYQTLRDELKLRASHVVVNQVFPTLFEPSDHAAIETISTRASSGSATNMLASVAKRRTKREQSQSTHIHRLQKAVPVAPTELPYLFVSDLRRKEIESLSKHFATRSK